MLNLHFGLQKSMINVLGKFLVDGCWTMMALAVFTVHVPLLFST